MNKKYISELIYNLLEKGYSKELIIFYISSTVDADLDIDIIKRLYKEAKIKWLKARFNDYENIKPVLSEKDKEIEERLEEEEKLKLLKFKETNIVNGIELESEKYKYIIFNKIISKNDLKFKSLLDIRKYEKEKLRELTNEITELKAIYEQYIRRWKILNDIDQERFYALKEIEQAKIDAINNINKKEEKNNSFKLSDNVYLALIQGTGYFLLLKFIIEKLFIK